jgi:hypothetical protein
MRYFPSEKRIGPASFQVSKDEISIANGCFRSNPLEQLTYQTQADNARSKIWRIDSGRDGLGSGCAAHQGLITPITETADETIGIVLNIRKSGANIRPLCGTLVFSGAYTAYGSGPFIITPATGVYTLSTREPANLAMGAPAGAAGAAGAQYVFLAYSHKADGTRIAYWGGPAATVYNNAGAAKTLPAATSALKHAIGNGFYSSASFSLATEVAEYFYIPRATTQPRWTRHTRAQRFAWQPARRRLPCTRMPSRTPDSDSTQPSPSHA